MDFKELCSLRFSARGYTSDDITDQQLSYILECARLSPKEHGDIDIAIAAEHICLAAAAIGLGSCWVCNFDASLCKEVLQLPAEEEPAVIVPIGHTSPDCPQKEKVRKPLSEIVTYR